MEFLLYASLFALGAVLASFIGVIAERVHTGEGWVQGRSRCNSCTATLRGRDLIPALSWIFSRGRCARCHARIPWIYPVSEITLGAVFVLGYAVHGPTLPLAAYLGAVSVLAFIVLYDLRHTIVPPTSSVLLVGFGFLHAFLALSSLAELGLALISAGVIALGFLALHVFSRGRAMGLGDAPVAFGLSLLVAPYAFTGLLFSFWAGGLFGIVVLVTRPGGPKMGIEVPFAPFLALGFLLAFFIQWNPLAIY